MRWTGEWKGESGLKRTFENRDEGEVEEIPVLVQIVEER